MEFAQGKEIDALQLKRCIDTRATEAEVDKSVKEAQSLQVDFHTHAVHQRQAHFLESALAPIEAHHRQRNRLPEDG